MHRLPAGLSSLTRLFHNTRGVKEELEEYECTHNCEETFMSSTGLQNPSGKEPARRMTL